MIRELESRRTRLRLRCAALAIVAALAAACSKGGGDQTKRGAAATPVRVAPVSQIDAPVNILASGIVEPVQTVAVTTQISGNLQDVLFKEGDVVQKGQVLFRIDPRPFAAAVQQATATLARDQAQAEAARKDDERYARLADMGYVSRSQADQMHATAVAQAATVEADRAAIRSANVSLGYATIRAPISGRTGSILQRQGNNVSPSGGPLVVINQISPVRVRFPVLEQDFPSLQRAVAAHPLVVTAMSSDSTQSSERGELAFLDNAVDSMTGTVTGKANFPNAGHRLWPGELVYLTVQLSVQRGVLAVPNEAVLTGQQGQYVFVVDQNMTAQSRNVAAGFQVGDLTVVQKGLALGERVVTDGQSRLNPGGKVALVSTGSDTGAASLSPGANGGSAGGDITARSNAGNGGGNTNGANGVNGAAGAQNGGGGAAGAAGANGTGSNGAGGQSVTSPPPLSNQATPAQSVTPATRTPTTTSPTTPTTTTPTTTTTGTGRPPGRGGAIQQ